MKTEKHTSFRIYSWMIELLGLKNNELLLYAFIYSFSNFNKGIFRGSLSYLCEKVGMSKSTALRTLKSLSNSGLLLRTERTNGGTKYVEYKHSEKYLTTIAKQTGVEVKNNTYFTIWSWMTDNFRLTGHFLTCYALIHSFSEAKFKTFKGNSTYIAQRLNISSKSVKRILERLIKSNYISEMREYDKSSKTFCFRTIGVEDYEASYEIENTTETENSIGCNANITSSKNNGSSCLGSQNKSGYSFEKPRFTFCPELEDLLCDMVIKNIRNDSEVIKSVIESVSGAVFNKLKKLNIINNDIPITILTQK